MEKLITFEDYNWREDLFDEETTDEKPAFQINDLGAADWAFRQIKHAKEEFEKNKAYADEEIARYRNFIKSEEQKMYQATQYFEGLLKEFYDHEATANPKFKLKTAVGTGGYRNTKKWDYGDESKLLEFLKSNKLDDFIRVKEEVAKNDLKKACIVTDAGDVVTEDGEIIEGIKVSEESNFYVKEV